MFKFHEQNRNTRLDMSKYTNKISRRKLLGWGTGLTVGAVIPVTVTAAGAKVDEDDPTAKAVAYVHDATQTSNSAFKAGSNCANCALYKTPEADWGPCALFPGKLVAGEVVSGVGGAGEGHRGAPLQRLAHYTTSSASD